MGEPENCTIGISKDGYYYAQVNNNLFYSGYLRCNPDTKDLEFCFWTPNGYRCEPIPSRQNPYKCG